MLEKTRFAVVAATARDNVAAYLPTNYEVVSSHAADPDGRKVNVVISGRDMAGWTLLDYVLPRLASGVMFGVEYPTLHDAEEAATAAMN